MVYDTVIFCIIDSNTLFYQDALAWVLVPHKNLSPDRYTNFRVDRNPLFRDTRSCVSGTVKLPAGPGLKARLEHSGSGHWWFVWWDSISDGQSSYFGRGKANKIEWESPDHSKNVDYCRSIDSKVVRCEIKLQDEPWHNLNRSLKCIKMVSFHLGHCLQAHRQQDWKLFSLHALTEVL